MTEQNTPANAEGLSIDKQIISKLDVLDADIHDLASITGLAHEYFDGFAPGKDAQGFAVFKLTNEQLDRFDYILRTAAFRAKLLSNDYHAAMNGGAA